MKVINTETAAFRSGLAPVDYSYLVEQEVLLEDNSKVFVQVEMVHTGELYYAVNRNTLFNESESDQKPLEIYDKLCRASKSKYYKNFVELDKILDEKIKDHREKLDDTYYYDRVRCGIQIRGSLRVYGEGVAEISEDKHLYLQVVQEDDVNTYSITESSIFMRMELGELYPCYFQNKTEVPFILETKDLNELGEYEYLKDNFNDILESIKEKLKELN